MTLRRLALTAALLALAACGSDGADGATAPAAAPPTVPAPTTTVPPTTAPPSTAAPTAAPTTLPPTAPLPPVRLAEVTRLIQPIALAQRSGDESLYLGERGGRVLRLAPGGTPEPWLDLTSDTLAGGERGLLDVAFSPDGTELYVHRSDARGDTELLAFAVAADGRLDPGSRRTLLRQPQPYTNHNGGELEVGPDGMLYLGLGDGGSGGDPEERAQDLSTILGKILRIDPSAGSAEAPYAVPADNPFVALPGARPEIWAWGLRNPWRFSFDRETGDLWVADVGQDRWEEVNRVPADQLGGGRAPNFGWDLFEGRERFDDREAPPDLVVPVHVYEHGTRGCSITGGFVYRGAAIPALRGAYVYADFCSPGIWALRLGPDGAVAADQLLSEEPSQIVSFGQDAAGELYVLAFDGTVARLAPA